MHIKKRILFWILSLFLTFNANVFSQQLGDWTTLNYLNVSRMANVAVLAYDTIIYTFGGFGYNTTPYPVENAVIYPDGSLSKWSIDSQTMKIARDGSVGFYYNGYIYALSGNDAVNLIGQCTTVERVGINPDGSLSEWEYINPLLKGVMEASLVLSPPYVYIIGGWNNATQNSNEVLRCKILSDGSLSEWSVLTSHLLYGRRALSSILVDSTIYVIGGYNLNYQSQMNKFEKATIFPDGNIGTFEICGTTGTYHTSPALLYDGRHIYIIGGYHGGGYYSYRGERVVVNSDGTLGAPEIAPGLQYETGGFGYVQASTGGYVIGGDGTGVQFAPFLPPTSIDKKYWEVLE